jgi:predicted metal-dependent phosphoesterase TrpH
MVIEAARRGLSAISLTDHDALGGIEEALDAGREHGVAVIPGVELSVQVDGKDLHVLGYLMDHQDPDFSREVEKFRAYRDRRGREMVEKCSSLGVALSYERVKEIAGIGAVGRPHVAWALFEAGHVQSPEEAFARYIGEDCPCYASKYQLEPAEAFRLITQAGGVPVWAHPGLESRDNLIPVFVSGGLKGLEAWHPRHPPSVVERYVALARQHGLLVTGGSDDHGHPGSPGALGSQPVPEEVVAELRRAQRG